MEIFKGTILWLVQFLRSCNFIAQLYIVIVILWLVQNYSSKSHYKIISITIKIAVTIKLQCKIATQNCTNYKIALIKISAKHCPLKLQSKIIAIQNCTTKLQVKIIALTGYKIAL